MVTQLTLETTVKMLSALEKDQQSTLNAVAMTMQLRKKAKKDQTIQTLILLNQRPKILQKSLKMELMLSQKMELMPNPKMELMPNLKVEPKRSQKVEQKRSQKMELKQNPRVVLNRNLKMALKKSLKVLEVLARKDQIMDITPVLYRPVRDMMMEIQSTQAIIALA